MAEYVMRNVPIRAGSVEEARRIGREIVAALYIDKDRNLVRGRRTKQDASDSRGSVEAVVRQYGGLMTDTDPSVCFRVGGSI